MCDAVPKRYSKVGACRRVTEPTLVQEKKHRVQDQWPVMVLAAYGVIIYVT